MFTFNRALRMGLMVLIAAVVNYYFSGGKDAWLVLSAFIVSQTTQGTPFRQSLILFITIILSMSAAVFLFATNNQLAFFYGATVLLLIFISYAGFISRALLNKKSYLLLIFAFILILAVLPEAFTALNRGRFIEVVIGSLIGIIGNQFIFQIKYERSFKQGLTPILRALIQYSQALAEKFGNLENNLMHEKIQVETALQSGAYPEWAFEPGFNPGLRSGFRFFLINIEHVVETFFSLNYLVNSDIDKNLLQELSGLIIKSVEKNQELLNILLNYFAKNKLVDIQSDFVYDISELETALQRIIPENLELLDISADYVALTGLVRDIKELRETLLKLTVSLPPL